MDTILVTGAGGLLGTHLVDVMDGSANIFACSRSGGSKSGANVIPLALDLSRPIDRARLPERLDSVVHIAQSSRFRDFPSGALDMTAVNVANTVALLDHAVSAGARTFVYASTGGVYGTGSSPFLETGVPAEYLGFYAASKRAGEILAQAYAANITVVILRFFFIYGLGQKREMLIPRLVDSVREGRPITLHGEDGMRFNPIHARDAAGAVVNALRLKDSVTINVAGPEVLNLRQVADAIGNAVAQQPHFDVRPAGLGDLVADIRRQTALLGRPQILFANGVRDAL